MFRSAVQLIGSNQQDNTIKMLISVTLNKLETINTVSDTKNEMNTDFCMCFLNNQNLLKTLFTKFAWYIIPFIIIPVPLISLFRARSYQVNCTTFGQLRG